MEPMRELRPGQIQTLERLAALHGIECEYIDNWGQTHTASADTLRALLSAMGVPTGTEEAVAVALAEAEQWPWRRPLPPVQVVRADAPVRIPLTLPEAEAQRGLRWAVIEEEGTRHEGWLAPADRRLEERRSFGQETFQRESILLPLALPPGYHRFELLHEETGAPLAAMRLIVTPRTCYQPAAIAGERRVWGMALPLYALRSSRNWGMGDFSDLLAVVDRCAELGADTVALNPLHALFPLRPEHASPYGPSSRLFLNVLYLDVESVVGFDECRAVQERVRSPEFEWRLQSLRDSETVDYAGVAAVKLPLLEALYQWFRERHLAANSGPAAAFRRFQAEQGRPLRLHALYEALQEHFLRQDLQAHGWQTWPEEYQDPDSPLVSEFADAHLERVEFFEFLQWQAEEQLARAGLHSLGLKLGIGLCQDLAVAVDGGGSEAWANRTLYARGASIGAPPDESDPNGRNWGMPPMIPVRLAEAGYQPFIAALRANMRHAGALRLDHVMGLMRLFWVPDGSPPRDGAYVRYPLDDLLGIVALESRRNRCMVVGEDLGTVPDEIREALPRHGILSCRLLFLERGAEGDFRPPAEYPAQALAAVSSHDLPTLAGFWQGWDLAARSELSLFPTEQAREQQVIGRAQDRARLLLALEREGLLPGEASADPASIPEMTPALAAAIHRYLARTPAKLMLLRLEDAVLQPEQPNLPGPGGDHPNWRYKLRSYMEELFGAPGLRALVAALRDEGRGETFWQTALPEPAPMPRPMPIPLATYRVQFNRDFTFAQAAEIVPYLHELGISHCYASPYLKARAGSMHGYDIVDHAALNPEIGTREDYERFVAALRERAMGQILDIVPNHMGIGSDDNAWWLDVLENGQASAYAEYFDIDWHPVKDELRGKVLLPFLGDHYGAVLEQGRLRLEFNLESGAFGVRYYEHYFPIAPHTYPRILGHRLERLELRLGAGDPRLLEFQSLMSAFLHLPLETETDPQKVEERRRDKEIHKRHLAELCASCPEIAQFIMENVAAFNGVPGEPASFDLLDRLLQEQAYRPAFWQAASDEINYRRFFDINSLAGLRQEVPEVFRVTHRLILELVTEGKVHGLRIDHPDGLYDPVQYYQRLQAHARAAVRAYPNGGRAEEAAGNIAAPLYVVVEKILAGYEYLPEDWPVYGTTGYEFANLVNGLFVYAGSESYMDWLYERFIGHPLKFEDLLYERKRLVMRVALSSELTVLATLLNRISEADRHTRDYTLLGLRNALAEVVACFPVYRTYVTGQQVTEEDQRYIDWAIARAKDRSPAADISIFDFIRSLLLLERLQENSDEEYRRAVIEFAMKFQQYTAPVMAKGLEDTTFYIYNRLVSLNEVGGSPDRFGMSIAAFHRTNQERMRRWPHAMLSTSTHDSKRSEDVRARIDVLSEMPGEWRKRVFRWRRLNRAKKREINGAPAPSYNDEYLLYQTLIGAWPLEEMDETAFGVFRQRIEDYMLKAVKEAKVHTSWINPNREYEEAVRQFVQGVLSGRDRNLFLADFVPFQRRVARCGMFNSLSQTLLKCASPGVPDIYQGNELWVFSLVDPDNRRPVDYAHRRRMLQELMAFVSVPAAEQAARVRSLLDGMEDGRPKLYLTWKALMLRRAHPEVFQHGDYLPLTAIGPREDHLCAFARRHGAHTVVAVAPRWFHILMGDAESLPLGRTVWSDTWIEAPPGPETPSYVNVLTGETVALHARDGQRGFLARDLLDKFPVALLHAQADAP